MSRHIGRIGDVLMYIIMCISENRVETRSGINLLCHHPWSYMVLWENSTVLVCRNSMYSSLIEREEGNWESPGRDIFLDYEGEGSTAVNMEPVDGVCLVFDSPKGGEPFVLHVAVEGPDTMAKKSIRAGIDHVIPNGG